MAQVQVRGRRWPVWLWLLPVPICLVSDLSSNTQYLPLIVAVTTGLFATIVLVRAIRGTLTVRWIVLVAAAVIVGVSLSGWTRGSAMTSAWTGVVLVSMLVQRGGRYRLLLALVISVVLVIATARVDDTAGVLTMAMVTALAASSAIGSTVRSSQETAARARSEAIDAERRRMASELHDVIAHEVAGIVVISQAARATAATGEDTEVLGRIEMAGTRAMEQIRAMVTTLRDPGADAAAPLAPTLTGPAAIRDAIDHHPVPVGYDDAGVPADALDPTGWLVLARTVAEALTNVRRHAGARTPVQVTLRLDQDRGQVELRVVDQGGTGGIGGGSGTGLAGLRERAAMAGGRLSAGPHKGGWQVQVAVPMRDQQEESQ